MKRLPQWLRVVGYVWALPVTLVGGVLALAALATGGRMFVHSGVLEAYGGLAAPLLRHLVPLRGGASAMTLGHVVLGRDAGCLQRTRVHERVHVVQYEWLGVCFVPVYAAACVLAAIRGGHYYRDNWFERQAVAAAARVRDN
jgi:hypothetical protein